jgi:hypothetical protein
MKSLDDPTRAAHASPDPAGARESELTGLPWFHTWNGVYLFVIGCFILSVGLLVALTVAFS